MTETILLLALAGIVAAVAWRMARDPLFTWGFALRSLAIGGGLGAAGLVMAAAAAWLLIRNTAGAAFDQALVLGFAVFLAAPLEGQRWLPRRDARRWQPSLLFRVAEGALLALVVILVLWGVLAPTHRCLA